MKCPNCSAPYTQQQKYCEFCHTDLQYLLVSNNVQALVSNYSDTEDQLISEIQSFLHKIETGDFAFSDLKRLQAIEGKLDGGSLANVMPHFVSLLESVYCDYVLANNLCLYGRTRQLFARFITQAD